MPDKVLQWVGMHMKYNPAKIEKKWQKVWAARKAHRTKDTDRRKPNIMLLTEFPYPSGNLHIGHWDAFALPDISARYLHMKGNNVLYPIGFDAFGLPAENAAIKNKINPRDWTKKNIATMTKQLSSMGATFDWSRTVATSDPKYYRWTQWMFLKMVEKGLAYRAKTSVNWCPKDKTVLANEQVIGGLCDRCDTPVEQKEIAQWMFKTTAYADRLIDDLKELDWPHATKVAQEHWIGRSEGAVIRFPLLSIPGQPDRTHYAEVFTTRPDTLFGATFLVISPELAKKWMSVGWKAGADVSAYVEKSFAHRELERMEQREKTGISAGIFAENPANKERIPVWIAEYVLGSYGTGAIMAVPAHDERDWKFAKKFNLPIKMVICPHYPAHTCPVLDRAYIGGGHLVASGKFDGTDSEKAKDEIAAFVGGTKKSQYRLRDWVLSRQRYWGVPIPMINCASCGYQPVPEKELPIQLPPLKDFMPTDDGRSPLAKATSWVKTTCPKCRGPAERETDTMDTFVDSSWYFMRYADPKNKKMFASLEKMKKWLPVALYVGGAEHNTMHLLYSRFFTKVLHDLGYVHFSEPFTARRNHGTVLGPDGQKMSKSHGNVVDPDKEVAEYGADTVRMYLAFMMPYDGTAPWDPKGITGVHRFLHRIWNLAPQMTAHKKSTQELDGIIAKTVKKVGDDITGLRYNTAVSSLMILLNEYEKHPLARGKKELAALLTLLAPFAPHMAEELWNAHIKKSSVHKEPWPAYDEETIKNEKITIAIQVNGKVRDTFESEQDAPEKTVKKTVLARPRIQAFVPDPARIKKFIYVKNRIVNIVV